ncbi:LuxR C-terminal-related transcriptional regulator [Actinacidiphila sp. DG2A-62]|uniref:helix-turn-helix domain-containing protein n=1 Tax=Actinacidiphila sp. DG2A-62 TaxID=3108821 RepID=UPI002DBF99BA|nr:LuxR C-terminal-related transcriptional regulator [Actinacidiphila sp. DG2A-62]MEC3997196.1 LuxR C-terminal-related transcriptional regulator [Actinacidiphila sp. DG2A-62]
MYLELRSRRSATASDIASALGLPAHECARILRDLRELCLVDPAGSGATFVALDPDTALARLFDAHRGRVAAQMQELEQFHRSTEMLVHRYRPAVLHEGVQVDIENLPAGQVRAVVQALVAAVRTATWSMHPGPLPPPDVLHDALAQDRVLLNRGVEVRAVYADSAASSKRGLRYLTEIAALGVNVRLAPQLPFDLVIFDSHTALLPGNPSVPAESALVLRGSRLMPTYVALFEDVWLRAVPFTPENPQEDKGTATDSRDAAVLRLLANGLTDEQIGRRLGRSPRTVGRIVSDLMDRMGAASRFQMGALAAARGHVAPVDGGLGEKNE